MYDHKGMPSRVFGLPTHILVVHASVVLVPVAAVLAVVVALWRRARERFGLAALGLGVVAFATVPLATTSGEQLRFDLTEKPLITRHVALGDQVLPVALLFVAALAALVVLDVYGRVTSGVPVGRLERRLLPRRIRSGQTGRLLATGTRAVAVVVVACSVLVTVAMVRAGDSGARAVWADYPGLRQPR